MEKHYIEGYGDRSVRAEIHVLPDAVQKSYNVVANLLDAQARLDRVAQLIEGYETPYTMELLATVHWVAEEAMSGATDADVVVAGVQKWSSRKQRLFKPEHIRIAWQRLRDQGWFTSADFRIEATPTQ